MNTNQHLSDLKSEEEGVIVKVLGHGSFRKRITEMGFVKGVRVKVIKKAPLQDPVEYEIMGYNISLRNSEAEMIEIVSLQDAKNLENPFEGTIITEDSLTVKAIEKGKIINIVLVGNPNCGKTTLFNLASGSHERIGNYSGVTVEAKEAEMKKFGYTFKITDLPGTYSITEYSPEELYVRNYITEKMPDIVVNVLDASNLDRNLYLTTQLIDMNIKVVIALNMYDELENKNIKFDYESLGEMIGIPIIPTVASKGFGVDELFRKIIDVYEDLEPTVRHIHINYGNLIESAIRNIQKELWVNSEIADKQSSRYIAIKLLETDKTTLNSLRKYKNFADIESTTNAAIEKLEKEYCEKSETIITDAKYGFIGGALKETRQIPEEKNKRKVHTPDDLLTHRIWGFPIFFAFMWIIFQATFTLGAYPMDWIETGVALLGSWISGIMNDGMLKDLIVNGIISGVGGVIVYLPNILILFFFISLMEDTGYMARAAFITDKLMHKIGLHGKSFIPLLMGFGCNVPSIMATRTLNNRNDRILTMLIVPFISCGARLPVYILLISAFFPNNPGSMLFLIYAIGVIVAIFAAIVLKKVFFKKEEVPFVMELPPYRIPTFKSTAIHMWEKGKQYLHKMGTVILLASIIIWALGYFPQNVKYSTNYDEQIELALQNNNNKLAQKLKLQKEAERQENSYIGRIGHAIAPVIAPLGFDWKMGVSIFTGLAAKEIVVSSMGILYQADANANESSDTLIQKIQTHTNENGDLTFTPLVAFSFMLFILLYFPCVAVIAGIRKEANWKWALFTAVYTTALAWIISFAVYQIGSLI